MSAARQPRVRRKLPDSDFQVPAGRAAIEGINEILPEGEQVLWQGRPDWKIMARDAFHVRKVGLYFAVLLLWRGVSAAYDGASPLDALIHAAWMVPLALAGIGLLLALAWASARTTIYAITSRRVVMRIGMALEMTINLPLARITSAGMRADRQGYGDIPMVLNWQGRMAWVHLWPHARPWALRKPEPMLRAIPDVAEVAATLATALTLNQASQSSAPVTVDGAADLTADLASRAQDARPPEPLTGNAVYSN